MRFRRRRRSPLRLAIVVFFAVLLIVVAGRVLWQRGLVEGTPVAGLVPPPTAPTPTTTVSPVPPTPTVVPLTWEAKAQNVATQYLDAWERRDYQSMYNTVSDATRQGVAVERFVGRYQAISSGAVITEVVASVGEVRLLPGATNPVSATVDYTVTFQSGRVGSFEERNSMPLVREGDQWRVAWSPDLIFRDLGDANFVRMDGEDPARGAILDRKGRTLAGPGSILSVGLVPGNLKDEARALKALSDYLAISQDAIKARYANAKPDWWIPLRVLPESRRAEATAKLAGIAGVEVRKKDARVYPLGPLAAHVVGYVTPVNAEDLEKRALDGYEEDDFIGRDGVEEWAERQLAGQKGGKLVIADPDGDTVRVLAQRRSSPGKPVQLTIDIDAQQQAEKSLGDRTGSIVLIDPRDNSVLAMASHPSFDPNAFVTGISDQDWQRLSNDPRHPFQNRATMSAYPTGSIFKVITMVAGMEKGGFKSDSQFESTGAWTGLPGVVMRDWKPAGHGRLDLKQGLVESVNTVFYELGKKLNSLNEGLLPDFARQFGLGDSTGILGVTEIKGTVPDPDWKQRTQKQPWYPGDAVNLGIGQGFLEATPLQMANVYAALANGGELRTPVLISRIGDGPDARTYQAAAKRPLPASPATLRTIRDAMKDVATAPKGTAYYAFRDAKYQPAAKTGSAENEKPDAHAWFAGYAPAEAAEIVVLVMIEGGKAGGEFAAPLARQIMDAHFARR